MFEFDDPQRWPTGTKFITQGPVGMIACEVIGWELKDGELEYEVEAKLVVKRFKGSSIRMIGHLIVAESAELARKAII